MVRLKNRYLLVEIECDQNVTYRHIHQAIFNAVSKTHGDFGAASIMSNLRIKMVNFATKIAIIRASTVSHRYVVTSIPFVTTLNNNPGSFRLIHLGGTIRSCNKVLLKYYQDEVKAGQRSMSDFQELEAF